MYVCMHLCCVNISPVMTNMCIGCHYPECSQANPEGGGAEEELMGTVREM